jgi:Spy/CpxP family protein refolding chaperone
MKKLMILTLALATALPMIAQTPDNPPSAAERAQHHVKMLTTLLGLTAAQQQQATTIFTNAENAEQNLHQNERTTHDSLRTAIKNNDAAAIDQIAGTMAQGVAQRISTQAKADAAFYQLLNPEQQTKMSDLQAEHLMDGPGRHGPPMMGFH